MEFYNSLSDDDKKTVDELATANSMDKELVAIAHKSGAPGAIKTLRDSIKTAAKVVAKASGGGGKPTSAEQKAKLETEITDLQDRYEKSVKSGQIGQQVSYKNAIQRKVNDLKALSA